MKPLSLCEEFITQLNLSLLQISSKKLSRSQRIWLSLCITGILLTNTVCWKRFERATIGKYSSGSLSKMFRKCKIDWDKLLTASVTGILNSYGITQGVLALDDTDNKRCKKTTRIGLAHKVKDKGTGGYFNGQEIVFLVLITNKVTIPVGYKFYMPQPSMTSWRKENSRLKRLNFPKNERPVKPDIDDQNYPSKQKVALLLLQQFAVDFPDIKIQCVLADALYGAQSFFSYSKDLLGVQIISQIKRNQKVKCRGKYIRVDEYFRRNSGVPQQLSISGGDKKAVNIGGARLFLKAHGCKRFIVALKYDGEEEYRYLIASDLTWRLTDIATTYTLRWLVEVFIQDWKSYEGWSQLAKQQGDDGSSNGLILSLLTDHCLILHPEQKALINRKLPALTVGSLRDLERMKAVVESIEFLFKSDESKSIIHKMSNKIAEVIPLRCSKKHMSGRDLVRIEATPGLKYMAA
ncbi:MAG: transposase [Legionellaceae bacterium]|nr:transposase [Legionellaceae bacterium]